MPVATKDHLNRTHTNELNSLIPVFDELYSNKKVDKRLRSDISASRAQMFIDSKQYELAVENLYDGNSEILNLK